MGIGMQPIEALWVLFIGHTFKLEHNFTDDLLIVLRQLQ